MNSSSYPAEVSILVNGKPVKQYCHDGKFFVEARKGTEYSIKVKNTSYRRIMVIPSVDGVNALNGNPATPSDGGYIVNGNSSMEIKGFRKDMDTVGAFKFTSSDGSYCNQVGLKGNNGVIGVIVYYEKVKPMQWFSPIMINEIPSGPIYRQNDWTTTSYSSAGSIDVKSLGDKLGAYEGPEATYCCNNMSVSDSAPVASAGVCRSVPANFDTGTTWGEKKNDSVVYVNFEQEDAVSQELTIYYASRDALVSMGVPIKEEKQVTFPKAFGAFATPPKDWKG